MQYNNELGRKSARANFAFTPTDVLDLSVNMSYGRTDTRLPQNDNSSNGLLRNAIRGVPGRLGNYGIGWLGLSPAEANIYDNQTRADRFVAGVTANYAPVEWFKNRAVVGVDHGVSVATVFYPIWRGTAPPPFGVNNANGAIYQFTPERRSYTLDYSGTISTGLPIGQDLTSDFSFGAQANVRQYEWTEGTGLGLVTDDVRLIGTAATTRADSDVEEQTSLGFFVQEQVGFANKLFVTAALRVDDNSAFGQDFSTVVYPKVSASYVISDEPFFSLPFVDNLRLRAAWGQAGNSPEPFSADRTYGGATLTEADGTTSSALRSTAYGNPNLQAETGSEIEVGFEASLLAGRAGVDFTYYNKRTYDALIPIPVPPSSGFGGDDFDGTAYRTRLENAGEIANSGVELSLFGTPVQGRNFNWDTRLGFSMNDNELVDLGGLEPQLRGSFATTQWIKEGYPLGSYFGVKAQQNPDGTYVKDANGRGILSGDTVYIGPSSPTREASLSNTLTFFGNVQLYVFADYKGGGYLWNAGEFIRYSNGVSRVGANPALDPEDYAVSRSGSTLPFVTSSDFVKLREVAVSFTVPQRFSSRFGTDQLSFTLSGRNLAMWTDYRGMDPEVNFSGIPTPGFSSVDRSDYMSVPMLRRFQASVNVRF